LSKLNVYLVQGPVDGYIQAIESIEKLQPLEKVKLFNLHIKGGAPSATDPNQAKLVRDLGARPVIQVVSHGFYSTVRLMSCPISSLVATLQLTEDPEDLMVCVLSECDIIAVDVDIDQEQELFEESIPVQGRHAFPWIRVKDAMES
jgi:hypothetical protein